MLRKSEYRDMQDIIKMIEGAKVFLKSNGVDQWQDGYPNGSVIELDIKQEQSYVLVEGDSVVGTTVLSFNGESTYQDIHDGAWLSDKPYGVIHRVAIDSSKRGSGLAVKLFAEAEALCLERGIFSIKVDTHEYNVVMQRLLKKLGYSYCGIIYLADGGKRLAFEKLL